MAEGDEKTFLSFLIRTLIPFMKASLSWPLLLLLLSPSVVSDSVRPHRRQPTRLPRPWDSPGKNTGVGCHFLLQCMKMKSESEVTHNLITSQRPPSPNIITLEISISGYEFWWDTDFQSKTYVQLLILHFVPKTLIKFPTSKQTEYQETILLGYVGFSHF